MTINANEYKSRIGLDSVYVAAVDTDSDSGYSAEAPEYLAPAAEASQEPTTNMVTQYADDAPYDVMTSEGETKITLRITNIPPELYARITGAVFNVATGRVYDVAGTPPYYALGFRSLKSNGSYRYYWFQKGKFSVPKEETVTRGETPDPKLLELIYTAIKTTYEFDLGSKLGGVKRVWGDEDTTNFSSTSWFAAVQTPEGAAPTSI
jgi:phi13 family phage major tail protein